MCAAVSVPPPSSSPTFRTHARRLMSTSPDTRWCGRQQHRYGITYIRITSDLTFINLFCFFSVFRLFSVYLSPVPFPFTCSGHSIFFLFPSRPLSKVYGFFSRLCRLTTLHDTHTHTSGPPAPVEPVQRADISTREIYKSSASRKSLDSFVTRFFFFVYANCLNRVADRRH